MCGKNQLLPLLLARAGPSPGAYSIVLDPASPVARVGGRTYGFLASAAPLRSFRFHQLILVK